MGEFNFADLVGYLRGLPCGTSGRKKLYTVFCHSCHIYEILRSKECGGYSKSHHFGWQCKPQRERGFSLSNTAALELYCKSN